MRGGKILEESSKTEDSAQVERADWFALCRNQPV